MPSPSRQLPAVRLPRDAHALAEQLAIDLTPAARTRLTITAVVAAAIRFANADREGFIKILTETTEDDSK